MVDAQGCSSAGRNVRSAFNVSRTWAPQSPLAGQGASTSLSLSTDVSSCYKYLLSSEVDLEPYYQTMGISIAEMKMDYSNLLFPLSWCLIKVILSEQSSH